MCSLKKTGHVSGTMILEYFYNPSLMWHECFQKLCTFAGIIIRRKKTMKIFSTACIKDLDAKTIEEEAIASIDLMERAATVLTEAIIKRWTDLQTPFVVFAGPGNNGGDALAVARMLSQKGYQVEVYLFNIKETLSEDCEVNRQRLADVPGVELHEIITQFTPPELTESHVVIDGLFGSGLNKPLSGGFAAVVRYINASPAKVVAIDIPSGLKGEDNVGNVSSHIIRADVTLTLQAPKLAFLFAENENYVGEWEVLDIGLSQDAMYEMDTDFYLTEPEEVGDWLKPRNKFAHKGDFGHALLIAGCQGMAGASILAARACLRSGIGVLKVHVPFCNNFIVQTAVPEAMTELDFSETCFATSTDVDDYQAVAVGPGLGKSPETANALLEQIDLCFMPMVVDADAINILGEHRSYLGRLPKGSILTPHPKEFERLVGKCQSSYDRLMKARDLAQTAQVYVLLKGTYSAIVTPQGKCYFNATGNPGMATAGSGDVLTGILLALLAQGYSSETAARLGAFVHGLAGDVAAKKKGVIAMNAGDLITSLPAVWKILSED